MILLGSKGLYAFLEVFWDYFSQGLCCLGAVQAVKLNGSSAGGALTPWLPLHSLAVQYRGLC